MSYWMKRVIWFPVKNWRKACSHRNLLVCLSGRPLPSTWYNHQTYVNTLDKAAMDRFLEITHEAYAKEIGDEFGKTVPTIFTDEPQFSHKTLLQFPQEKRDVILPGQRILLRPIRKCIRRIFWKSSLS